MSPDPSGNAKGEVTREQVRREALGKKMDADQTMRVLQRLERAGWLRKVETKSGSQGGRPPLRWEVNPRLSSHAL
jgi:hypothetical protein